MQQKKERLSNQAVRSYKIKSQLIRKLRTRFATYGYEQVHTPAFEDYDTYASIQKTVNKNEMIKVIDRSGKVLVLRPDGTIPITRSTALDREINGSEQRLFYIFNVYREQGGNGSSKESTQAGVELFGNKQPEADAEVIALAVHTLKEIGFDNFKLEVGHAGFFKELVEQANLTDDELQQLEELIQSKNMVEMEPFLKQLKISEELQQALYAIPLLYGNPQAVLEETKAIIRNEHMQEVLNNLKDVTEVLADYGILEHLTLNLGLINNMHYYTDIIFQGFVENIGKPVLMGGRYDQLGEQFGKAMPAIGFAYEVDVVLEALKQHKRIEDNNNPPLQLLYVPEARGNAFSAAKLLREQGYPVITKPLDRDAEQAGIIFQANGRVVVNGMEHQVKTDDELLNIVEQATGGV
ncbi:ATP phosphoribosyltransferase regulatory subunit [Oceanobacillus alkalisoli]|uniref:ATP phosphoribosyltransferase regulatory subunit n=1 Tax=Oceanobacillus alkalisoli TaxID=2925113 RepID=UPI001EEFDC3D|nr:ATP phosphoribosyltransferase regulatory subunit [Oceanobacillus alkalisoli]MCF3944598.1 ATP phosphoribosyltransferase regulatory subunit [Oceanobacillus alkalisoli]MCG5104785.1 ATP phosphoribosyltransferase regulatory subunit [Oceanobacillus alkalisoli]